MLARNLLKLNYLFATLPVAVLSFTTAAHAWSGPYGGSNSPWENNPWGAYNYSGYAAPIPPQAYGYPQAGPQQPYYPPAYPYPYRKSHWGNWSGGNSLWNNTPFGAFSGPWDSGPWNPGWMDNRGWKRNNFFDGGPGGWMDPEDPRGSMSKMWDDLLNAPNEIGEMPGGWTAPSVKVPNPVDVGDEFEATSRKAPKEAADQMNNFRFN